MNWHFRTLGMGTINYRKAAKRLAKEVESSIKYTFDQAKINQRVVDSTEVKE